MNKPVDWDELYPGRFIKFGDLRGRKVTLEIAAVDLEELEGDKGKVVKGILTFNKTEKGFPLNKTNGICLREMFGRNPQEWVGKRVILFPTKWAGDDCIRIWGSPDIDAQFDVPIALPKKKPFKMTMHTSAEEQAA